MTVMVGFCVQPYVRLFSVSQVFHSFYISGRCSMDGKQHRKSRREMVVCNVG